MDYVPRILEGRLADLAGTFGAIVLTGPRQAGKTTLLKHAAHSLCPDAEYFSFDTPSQVDVFRRDPDLFFANHPGPLILDEVQHAPDILP